MSSVTDVFWEFPKNFQNSCFKREPADGCYIIHQRTPLDECFRWGIFKKNFGGGKPSSKLTLETK